ncbi:MAG: family hydrolase [Actinomycetia bacterium]|nr:family hydrolase [Actinomycetes bacterium]
MGTAPLHEKYDVALLDLDGVVYLGGTAIPGAAPALQRARAAGMHLAYVTNNASRTPAAVAELLRSMDVPARPADVVTSPQAAARLLADKLPPGAAVLVIGSLALRIAVRERGLRPVSSAAESPLAVVQGYAPGIDYPALAEGALAVRAGALFVGTNADSTLPGPRGIAPGNGSLLRVIAHATGAEPVIAGKPELPLHHESIIRTEARRPLVVGDRLDTDIEAASRAAADSLLVFTGVSRPAELPVAPPEHRPTYLALTLDALTEAYPDVTVEDGAATCNGWTARWQSRHGDGGGASIALDGTGAPIDGLRALCAAAWSREGTTAGAVSAALSRIALS